MGAKHLKQELERAYGATVQMSGDRNTWTAKMSIVRGSITAEYEALGQSPFEAIVCLAFILGGLGCAAAPRVI